MFPFFFVVYHTRKNRCKHKKDPCKEACGGRAVYSYLLQKFDYRLENLNSLIVPMLDSDTFLRFMPEKQRVSAVLDAFDYEIHLRRRTAKNRFCYLLASCAQLPRASQDNGIDKI